MSIVVLDGYTLNPGDLSWDALESLGDCTVFDRTAPELVVERASGRTCVLTNKVVLNRPQIEKLPDLRYIGVLATGTNVVDLQAARERGIVVTNVPDYSTASVAQLVFALLLELTSRVGVHSEGVSSGKWSRCADFSYTESSLVELDGLTLGIVGYGRIGRRVAEIARAFGMRVLVHTRTPRGGGSEAVRFMDLEPLLKESDIVTLHCPLTASTAGLINAERLAWMKRSAFLINTGRGPLVDEPALAAALNAGRLAGAGLDVLSTEPPPPDHPLLTAPNCVITPHIGWATVAARKRLMQIVVDNVRAFLDGQPQNVVRPS